MLPENENNNDNGDKVPPIPPVPPPIRDVLENSIRDQPKPIVITDIKPPKD